MNGNIQSLSPERTLIRIMEYASLDMNSARWFGVRMATVA
jgi:hypothetical protein